MKKIKTIAQIKDIELFKKKMLAKVEKDNSTSCWVWRGSKNYDGYGNFSFERRIWSAHRSMYELFNAPIIPEENSGKWWVLHKCDNPSCVNPEHLYIGSAKDNARDMADRNRMRLGHRPLSESYGKKLDPYKRYGTVYYEINNEVKKLSEWSELSGVNFSTLGRRLQDGWPENDLFKPTNIYNRHINRKGFTTYKRFSGVAEVDSYIKSKAPTTCDSQGLNFVRNCGVTDMTSISTISVPFHGANLCIVNHDGNPYVPMKPIIEGMGLDWASQFTKLKKRFSKGIVEIAIPSKGGEQSMICLAMHKLTGWLYSIMPNKVKPEIRDKVIQYQEECDDVLYEYWTTGEVKAKKSTTTDDRAPLRNAVDCLMTKKRLSFPKAYGYVHAKYGVNSIDEVPLDLLPEAVDYIYSVALEGEYIPKQESLPIESELNISKMNVNALHCQMINIQKIYAENIRPSLLAIKSNIEISLTEKILVATSLAKSLQNDVNKDLAK